MAIPLIRIHPNELPVNKPLPYPIFAKSGRLLLARGCLFPANLAEDLLRMGLYRISDDDLADKDFSRSDDSSQEESKLSGLMASVESMQLSFLEPGGSEKTVSNVDFIGMIPGVSLVTSLPQRAGRQVNLGVGQLLSVRVCAGRYIYGFGSQVLCSYKFPQPHVHLEFPAHYKTMVLRHSERVKVRILAVIKKSDGTNMPVSIVELSGSGAAFVSEFDTWVVGDAITLNFNLNLHEQSYPLSVNGIIRRVKTVRSRKMQRIGMQLLDLTNEQKLLMQACIYENL
ncbi:flagellar brake protein [Candidatus Woesearchaeota archaeon]|nr:flagellar brake protein [Candidatus Woesearchaeota archaeon]